MQLIGAALGDGVHLAACGLAEFDGVVRGLSLELLDGVDRIHIRSAAGAAAGFREQHLVVIRAVYVVLVVEAADAVEADQSATAVLRNVGREQHEVAPVARIHGKVFDQILIDDLRNFGLLRVEDFVDRRKLQRWWWPRSL